MTWARCVLAAALLAPPCPGQEGAEPVGVVPVVLGAEGSLGGAASSARLELLRARRAGAEAIFWTPGSRLLGGERQASHFSLDGPAEPLDAGEDWTARPALERGGEKRVSVQELRPLAGRARKQAGNPTAEGVFDLEQSRDGSASLRLSLGGSNTAGFRDLAARLELDPGSSPTRSLAMPSLAMEVRARVHVLPLEQSVDGRAFFEFRLSEQPHGQQDRGLRSDVLHYYLSRGGEAVEVRSGTVFIPVPFEAGVWNELVFELSEDALAHTAGGYDNALSQVQLGVESRFQSPAAARFDAFSLERDVRGAAAEARLDEVLGAAAQGGASEPALLYRGLKYDALLGGTLLELGPRAGLGAEAVALEGSDAETGGGAPLDALARAARARGSLVAEGNPFESIERSPAGASRLETLGAAGLHGADLLVIEGTPKNLTQQVGIWDALARRGLFPVGIGAGGELSAERHALMSGVRGLLTFVLASSTEQGELLDALRRGRAVFGDPGVFGGALDLESARGFRMGQVVLTDRPSAEVSLLRIGAPRAGEVYRWHTARRDGESFEVPGELALVLAELPDLARATVLDGGGAPVAFSNALHFVRALPPGGLAAERAAFDLAGVRCLEGRRAWMLDARATEDGRGVRVEARAEGAGELRLLLPGDAPVDVTWSGLRGSAEQDGALLRLVGLAGEGSVTVGRAP